MERSQIYFLSTLLILLSSCSQREWYKKEFSEEVKKQYSPQLRAGRGYYYQGSEPEQFQLKEAFLMDSTDADLWREFGTARVKRGIADEMEYFYAGAVKRKPEKWAGFRGYLYLYFYRDYKRAIADFHLGDEANGQIDYSQGQRHDYMRGICYYGLKDYEQALTELNSYIDDITESEGADWVDVYALLYKGLALAKLRRFEDALVTFDKAEKLYPNLSDLFFHRARIACVRKDYSHALDLLAQAKAHHEEGYYHQRPYVEVLEQIHPQDIEKLQKELEAKLYPEA